MHDRIDATHIKAYTIKNKMSAEQRDPALDDDGFTLVGTKKRR